MHVGTSVTYTQQRLRQAAQPTHNSPLTLTLTHWPHGARTLGHAPTHPTPREATRHQNATPPNYARGVAPNRLDVAHATDPQPTIATARASPVESNALNGPTRLTATMPRRARTGSPQLNLRSDGRRLRSASGSNCPALLKTACSAIGAIQLRRDARLRRRLWVTSSTIPQ